MNHAIGALRIVLSAAVLTAIGCTANQKIRTNFEPSFSTPPDPTAVIEVTPDYKLGFVEFDDQGQFWDDQQRVKVEKMIREEAGLPPGGGRSSTLGVKLDCDAATAPATVPAGDAKAAPTTTTAPATGPGIILVAFVHGWKDNASSDNEGVKSFRKILKLLNKVEHVRAQGVAQGDPGQTPRKVVGVYMGWRGLSATWEPFKELSIWERKDTAHRVGGYGAMTQLFTELENIQKDSLETLANDAARTELIIIGHSLGGGAVYSALSQIITERFVNSIALPCDKRKRLKPLGDQIILLNPAFEAVRHSDLDQMAKSIDPYPADQRPVLSIFTSRGDSATHYAFPLSRFFSTLFESDRPGDQKAETLDAVGWFKPFITHDLAYNRTGNISSDEELYDAGRLKDFHEDLKKERRKWVPGNHPPKCYRIGDCTLKPVSSFRPGDPFLVVSVDQKIMKNHTDIADRNLIDFIGQYIQFCQVDVQDHSN